MGRFGRSNRHHSERLFEYCLPDQTHCWSKLIKTYLKIVFAEAVKTFSCVKTFIILTWMSHGYLYLPFLCETIWEFRCFWIMSQSYFHNGEVRLTISVFGNDKSCSNGTEGIPQKNAKRFRDKHTRPIWSLFKVNQEDITSSFTACKVTSTKVHLMLSFFHTT